MSFQQYNVYDGLTAVRLASTSNIAGTYQNGPSNNGVGATLTVAASSLTVDSVAAAVGDRLLLQTQTNTNEQGIYVVNSIGSTVVLQRSADQQCIEQMKAGQFVSVAAGSVNAGNFYTIIEPLPAALGVNALTFNADPSAGGVSFSGPASTANALVVFSDTALNIKAASTTTTLGQALNITGALGVTGAITASTNLTATAGNVTAGSSGHAGFFTSFPGTAANGSFLFKAVNNASNFAMTVSNATTVGQATVVSVPDPGAATANFLLDAGTGAAITVNNLKYGATPVAQVDPASCTITAAAGAANHCTITIQLKDGSGTNMSRVLPFKVYLATDNTGLTLQSAASTGYSVSSGGVKDPTGSTTITQGLAAFSSATGGCVVDLLDTGKGTGNLILMLPNGFKASAAITAGSYG
jgi:hypothetical protein